MREGEELIEIDVGVGAGVDVGGVLVPERAPPRRGPRRGGSATDVCGRDGARPCSVRPLFLDPADVRAAGARAGESVRAEQVAHLRLDPT